MSTFCRMAFLLIGSLLAITGQSAMLSVASAHTSALLTGHIYQADQACPQPPQNGDLMALSDAQLQYYGLPTHAVLNENPQEWSSVLAHARHRECGSTPDPQKKIHLPPIRHHSNNTGYTSDAWAGNVAYGNRGTYREAVVDFNIPTVIWTGAPSDAVIWAGVGGDEFQTSPVKLVQAGIESYPYNGGGQFNAAWWEVWPDLSQQYFHFTSLSKGDHIHVYISSNINNDGYDYFLVQDITQNSYNDYTDTASQHFSDSATGECIVERPALSNGNRYPLAEFNPPGKTEQLSSCDIANSSGQYNGIGNWPHYYYTMVNGSKTLAYPGSITNNGLNYPIYWVASS